MNGNLGVLVAETPHQAKQAVLQALGVSKRYQGRDVLMDVELEVYVGDCLAILGANSVGKTTLLRCLSGATRPTSGTVRWFGQTEAARDIVCRIGSLEHECGIYSHFSVRENLVFAARMFNVGQPADRAEELLTQWGLQRFADERLHSLSRGIWQRVAVARSIVHDPEILLLDEPFNGLDADGCDVLTRLIETWRAIGRTICFSTHQLEFAERLANRVVCLRRGLANELGDEPLLHGIRRAA